MGVCGLCFRFFERICFRSRDLMLIAAVSMVSVISPEIEVLYDCAAC